MGCLKTLGYMFLGLLILLAVGAVGLKNISDEQNEQLRVECEARGGKLISPNMDWECVPK